MVAPSPGRSPTTEAPIGCSSRDAAGEREDVPLIVAPDGFGGDFDRGWLIAVQLYGVRSARNWGMGDFTDLRS